MSKFVVIVFPSETKAYEGTRALKQLHAEASLTLYGTAVVQRDKDGKISIKESSDPGPLGFGVGAFVGGLVGLLAGPVGAAVGLSYGALVGGIADLTNAGVQMDYLDKVSKTLTPGKTAVVAEIEEDWITPLDTRMEAIGGEVIREWRWVFEDEQIERSIQERQAELTRLNEEFSRASQDRKAKIKARIDEAQGKLNAAAKRAQERISKLQQESDAKIKELEQQLGKANGDARTKIEQRITATRADYQRRTVLLKQSWKLAQEALTP